MKRNLVAVHMMLAAAVLVLVPSASFAQKGKALVKGTKAVISGGSKNFVEAGTSTISSKTTGLTTGRGIGTTTASSPRVSIHPNTPVSNTPFRATLNSATPHAEIFSPDMTLSGTTPNSAFDAPAVPATNRTLVDRKIIEAGRASNPGFEITEGGLPRHSSGAGVHVDNMATPRLITPVKTTPENTAHTPETELTDYEGEEILADLETYEAMHGHAPTWNSQGTPLLTRTYAYLRAHPYTPAAQQIKNGVLSVNIRQRGARLLKNLERFDTPHNRKESQNFIETFPDVPQAQALRERLEVLEGEAGSAQTSLPTAAAGGNQIPPVKPTTLSAEMPEETPHLNYISPEYIIPAPNHTVATGLSNTDMRAIARQQETIIEKIDAGNVEARYYIGKGKSFNPLEQSVLRARAEGKENSLSY